MTDKPIVAYVTERGEIICHECAARESIDQRFPVYAGETALEPCALCNYTIPID